MTEYTAIIMKKKRFFILGMKKETYSKQATLNYFQPGPNFTNSSSLRIEENSPIYELNHSASCRQNKYRGNALLQESK